MIDRINITCGVYPDWIKNVRDILRENTIGTSINGPYKNKATAVFTPNPLSPGCFYLRLNKYFPKGRQSGLDQHQVFRNSIEYWDIQNLIVKRKYEILCKITKQPLYLSEVKTQCRMK